MNNNLYIALKYGLFIYLAVLIIPNLPTLFILPFALLRSQDLNIKASDMSILYIPLAPAVAVFLLTYIILLLKEKNKKLAGYVPYLLFAPVIYVWAALPFEVIRCNLDSGYDCLSWGIGTNVFFTILYLVPASIVFFALRDLVRK